MEERERCKYFRLWLPLKKYREGNTFTPVARAVKGMGEIILAFIMLCGPMKTYSQIGLHVSNYQGPVIFARSVWDEIIPVDTLNGSGLYVYSNGRLSEGIYLFILEGRQIEFPVGDDQSFRLIADNSYADIQSSVQVSGSQDNNAFAQFCRLGTEKEKNIFWEQQQEKISDPFIRAYIKASLTVVPPDSLSTGDRYSYLNEHFFDNVDFSMQAIACSPLVKNKIVQFFNERSGQGAEAGFNYISLLMDRHMPDTVRRMISGLVPCGKDQRMQAEKGQ